MLLKALNNEKELLSRVAYGDEYSYQVIFNYYWDPIYSTAFAFTKSAELSQDLAQDIFIQIWVKREKLNEINRFESFLYITARNLIFDTLRKKVYTVENGDYLKRYFEETTDKPDAQLELKEFEETIHHAINQLPPQQQTAFRLSRFNGLSHEEISVQMGISRQSVKSYIVRAIVTLRKSLAEHPDQYLFVMWGLFFLKKFF